MKKKNFNQIQLYYLTICPLSAVKTPWSGFMKLILLQKLCKYKKIKWEIYRFAKKIKNNWQQVLKTGLYFFRCAFRSARLCLFFPLHVFNITNASRFHRSFFANVHNVFRFLSWLRKAQFSISRMLIMVYLKPIPAMNYR